MPLLRIILLQLEMIDRVVQDGTAIQPTTNKILDEADTFTMATRRVRELCLCRLFSSTAFSLTVMCLRSYCSTPRRQESSIAHWTHASTISDSSSDR